MQEEDPGLSFESPTKTLLKQILKGVLKKQGFTSLTIAPSPAGAQQCPH